MVVTIGTERILLLDNHGQVVDGRLAGVHFGLHNDGDHGNHDPTHCLFMMVILMVIIMWIIGRKNQAIISLQELQSIELKAREIALGDEGYFAFHFQVKPKHINDARGPIFCQNQVYHVKDNEHKIGYLSKDLQLQKNYEISWENWNRS